MNSQDKIADRYLLLHRLGSGGMSEVWLGEDEKLDRKVAIKILQDRLLDSPPLRERFLREASLTAKLSHPNIVPVFDQGILEDGKPYIVMEYIVGETLSKRELRGMSEEEALHIFDQILEGVGAAHRMGIVHRDLKPDNILVDEKDHVKIFDFGVARNMRDLGTDTESGTIIGTARYLSPEQAHGEGADERSDLYSVGIILYEALAGRTPWGEETAISALVRQSTEPAEPPSKFNEEVPLRLDEVTLRAIAYRPDLRFQSAEEFRQALDSEKSSSKRWLWILPVLFVLLAIFAWWYWSGLRTVPELKGKTLLEARSLLFKEDLQWSSKRSPSEQPRGTVLLSNPDAGDRIKEGTSVILYISSGPEESRVPGVTGLDLEDALRRIEKSGFSAEIKREPSPEKNGTVLATSPEEGESLPEGEGVILYVSENKTKILRPPNCQGLLEEECLPLLGLFSVKSESISSSKIKGTVVKQSFFPPRKVTLFVSEGSPGSVVPDLLGLSLSEAQRALSQTPFGSLVQYRETEQKSQIGSVIQQSPRSGKQLESGEVLLVVGKKAN